MKFEEFFFFFLRSLPNKPSQLSGPSRNQVECPGNNHSAHEHLSVQVISVSSLDQRPGNRRPNQGRNSHYAHNHSHSRPHLFEVGCEGAQSRREERLDSSCCKTVEGGKAVHPANVVHTRPTEGNKACSEAEWDQHVQRASIQICHGVRNDTT